MRFGKPADELGPERIYAFSDGVFSIIITIMVLELKRPASASFHSLLELWPTWLGYAVSYVFIAIVWMNHHFLMRFIGSTRLSLMWANFAHLFCVSLIPFLTEWLSDSRLEAVPVAMYAFDFLLVNITYLWLVRETLGDGADGKVPATSRHMLHLRSFISIVLFTAAMIIAFWLPCLGFGLIVCCLVLYLRPEIPPKTKHLS